MSKMTLWSWVLLACLAGLLVAILVPDSKIAYNSGSRERLMKKMRDISIGLVNQEKPAMPENCLTVNWYRNGGYERVVFQPVAIRAKVPAELDPNEVPIWVMTPLYSANQQTPTTLSAPEDEDQEHWDSHHHQVCRLFHENNVNDAVVLMSDGKVASLSIDELEASCGLSEP